MMKHSLLGRCSEHLYKAVLHMAVSPGTPKEKLRGVVENTGFGSIAEADFPNGPLRDDFQAIKGKLSTASEPQIVVNIAAMTDEEEQIVELSDDVSRALGKT